MRWSHWRSQRQLTPRFGKTCLFMNVQNVSTTNRGSKFLEIRAMHDFMSSFCCNWGHLFVFGAAVSNSPPFWTNIKFRYVPRNFSRISCWKCRRIVWNVRIAWTTLSLCWWNLVIVRDNSTTFQITLRGPSDCLVVSRTIRRFHQHNDNGVQVRSRFIQK